MDNVNKNLSNEFGVEPILDIVPQSQPTEIVPTTELSHEEIVKNDYDEVRRNIKTLIQKSTKAVDGILNVANETDKPTAYEVAADLIRASLEANNQLMQLHSNVKEMGTIKQTNNQVTNNSIYIGSTKDLVNLIRKNRKGGDDRAPQIEEVIEPLEIIDQEPENES